MDCKQENSDRNPDLPKLPFKRLKLSLLQLVGTAIPLHVQLLKKSTASLESLKAEHQELELHREEVNAARIVQLLKADLYELETLNIQVREDDKDLFNELVLTPTKDIIEVLSLFMELHSDVLAPFPETDDTFDDSVKNITPLVCNYDQAILNNNDELEDDVDLDFEGEQRQAILTSKHKFDVWAFLQSEFIEINALIKKFSNLVFRQKESVDSIEDNIEHTNKNVVLGTEYLKKASKYKAATFPVVGAVLGGLILGPAGALVGFKLLGSVACLTTGSALGYGLGSKLKQKQTACCDIEMKAITYPTKSKSQSTPDLSVVEPEK